jgi:hypothetical protein
MTSVRGDKVLLYVHGATYPSSTAFDLPLNGMSWMDYIARHGYDVYLIDPARLRVLDAAEGDGRARGQERADRAHRDRREGRGPRRWNSSASGAAWTR